MKKIYVSMVADLLHAGHIKILKEALNKKFIKRKVTKKKADPKRKRRKIK